MAVTPGTFDCTKLDKVTLAAQTAFPDGILSAGKNVNSVTIQTLKQAQTANLISIADTNKKRVAKVFWLDDCETAGPTACTNSCDISGGTTAGSECQDYEMTGCKEYKFSISESDFNDNITNFTDAAGAMLATRLRLLDESWNKDAIAFLNANAGVNSNPAPYTVVGNCTEIPSANWNADIMGYFELVAYYNRFRSNVMVTGNDKLRMLLYSLMNSTMPQAQSDLGKMRSLFNINHDGIGFATTGNANKTFTWNGGSAAFVHKNYYSDRVMTVPVDKGEAQVYSVNSPTIPGVMYDVIHTMTCDPNVVGRIQLIHNWKVLSYGDLFLNPLGCDSQRTGILCFNCV